MRIGKKFNSGLILGAAAGTALGWLMFSKKGKKVRKDAQEKISHTSQQVRDKISEASDNLRTKVASEIDNLSTKIQSAWSNGKDQVEQMASEAESKAKKAVKS